MTYIMSEYEYGVACIAHGEEDATVMFLLKAGFVGFDGDDLLLKQQAGKYTPTVGEQGLPTQVRQGRQGEEKPGQLPGMYMAPGGAVMQPTRTQQQFSIPVLRPSEQAQVRSFAQQQGMEPTRAAPGEKGPSAFYDFGPNAPKIPASMMERAKARLGRMGEQGKQFLDERRGRRASEAFTGAMAGQSEEAQRNYLANVARDLGVDVSELGKPKTDAAPAAAPAQETATPAAPAPKVPTDVAPETAPKPETAPEPETAPKPKTAPTADPAAGDATRTAIKDKTTTTGKVGVEPSESASTEDSERQKQAMEMFDRVQDRKQERQEREEEAKEAEHRREMELRQQEADLNAQLEEVARRQGGGATTPSMPEAQVPPASATAPEGVEQTPFQTLAGKLAGAYPSAKRTEEHPYGQSAGRILSRLQMGEKPFGEGYDPELGPLSISKPLTPTQMDKLRGMEGIEELYPQITGLEDILNPKPATGGGPPAPADMEFVDRKPVDPNADPMDQQLNLSYDSPMDLAWDALLFRKTHQ